MPFCFLRGAAPSPFVIKRLNDKLDSYAYAFGEATGGAEAVEIARARELDVERVETNRARAAAATAHCRRGLAFTTIPYNTVLLKYN